MIKFDRNLLYYKLPPLLYAAAILLVSSISTPSAPDLGIAWGDKIYHFGEYFIFGILVLRAFPEVRSSPRKGRYYLLLFAFGLTYAFLDEIVQYFVPTRDSSIGDTAADAIGFLLGGFAFIWYRRRHCR